MYQNSSDNGQCKPGFRDKMKQKMSQLGDKIKETNFPGIGNIKGLVKGYDNIDDNKKAGGFHGFQSGGGMNSDHGLDPSGTGGSGANAFGRYDTPTASSWAGASGPTANRFAVGAADQSINSFYGEKKKKKKKTKVTEITVSSESESESESGDESDSDCSSEDEETRKAREKEERRQARRERKKAEAAAAAAADAEALAKAERKSLRKAKREAKETKKGAKQHEDVPSSSPVFTKGSVMMYKNKEQVSVIGVHTEDPGDPYYTVLTKKGREKQTTAAHLSPMALDSPLCALESESPASLSGSCCERMYCKTETGPTTPSAHDCHDPFSHCDDIVSLKETLRSIRDSLGQEWVAEMYQRFEASAGSNGNAMDSECFGQFLEPFGIPEANWGMYFHGFDRAGNGLVDLREFLLGMAFLGESKLSVFSPEMLEERACVLFRIYDQNKDGTLDFEELTLMLSHLHTAAGDMMEPDAIFAEAREILQVLPTGTLTHGIALNVFVQAVQSNDILKSTTALLKQGIPQKGEETSMAQMAEEFADVLVNSQPSSPAGRRPMGASVDSPASPFSEGGAGGSKMDLSAFFTPPGDDSSSSDEE